MFLLYQTDALHASTAIYETFIQAGVAFLVDLVVTLAVTAVTRRPDPDALGDIVWSPGRSRAIPEKAGPVPWWKKPLVLGGIVLAGTVVLNILFA